MNAAAIDSSVVNVGSRNWAGLYESIDAATASLYSVLLSQGIESAPRGMKVKELLGSSIAFDMRRPLMTHKARKLGYRFAPAEAAWILSGDNRLETIKRYSPFIWEFSDDGFFYSGAYGPRVIDQLTYVCDVLSADPDTRQAVIEVWRPNPRPGRDIPCTLSYQFIARDGRLHCVQSMRSSDAWLGYPYDCFNAAMLTGYVMLLLRDRKDKGRGNLRIGSHTMLVASNHAYERNWGQMEAMVSDAFRSDVLSTADYGEFDPYEFASPQDLIAHLWALAAQDWQGTKGSWLTAFLEARQARGDDK